MLAKHVDQCSPLISTPNISVLDGGVTDLTLRVKSLIVSPCFHKEVKGQGQVSYSRNITHDFRTLILVWQMQDVSQSEQAVGTKTLRENRAMETEREREGKMDAGGGFVRKKMARR